MFGRSKPEVLVVGAGPIGQFTALSLVQRGVKVRIVDEEWRSAAHSYALALHPETMRILDRAGALPKILPQAHIVRRVALYEGEERRAEIDLSRLGGERAFLAVVRQSDLEETLESALRAHGVSVQWNHRVSNIDLAEDHAEVTIDRMTMENLGYAVAHTEWVIASSKKVRVPFVIGADGYASIVRRTAEIDFDRSGPTLYFAVFEFRTDAETGDELRFVLDEDTTSVLWPLADGYYRWSFQLTDFVAPAASRSKDRFLIQREELPELTDDHLQELLASRAPWFSTDIKRMEWRTVVRFEQRLASRVGSGRAWLAGDAAHMALPMAVQSMNVGMREADELAEIVTEVLRGNAGEEQLEEYNHHRVREWRSLLGLEGETTVTEDCDPWIAKRRDRLIQVLPASGEDLLRLLGQVGVGLVRPEESLPAP